MMPLDFYELNRCDTICPQTLDPGEEKLKNSEQGKIRNLRKNHRGGSFPWDGQMSHSCHRTHQQDSNRLVTMYKMFMRQ